MRVKKYCVVFVFLALVSGSVVAGLSYAYAAGLPDGTLVRSEGEGKVYYLESGKKRWIDSAETFHAQGFRWEDINVRLDSDVAVYGNGEPITATTQIVMPSEAEVIPDLLMLPPFNFHIATRLGRTILKFSSTFWNAGKGPLELVADSTHAAVEEGAAQDVFQRIARKDGSERRRVAGTFEWHDPHEHFHFHDFVDYLFASLDSPGSTPLTAEKTTRCIQDWEPIDLGIPGAAQEKGFPKCTKERQGVSVGWGDLYEYTLADQYLDVHDLPSGNYRLTFQVNPRNNLIESRTDNNVSFADVRLDPPRKTVEVTEFAAPCWHPWHKRFPEGTLVRGEGDGKVYVLHHSKKRWLRTQEIFNSYGYAWKDVQVLSKAIVDSIPYNNLVRVDGTAIYALNDYGYKRHILNADVFNSYAFGWGEIAEINQTEFSAYRDARYLRRAGESDVYEIGTDDTKHLVSDSRAIDPAEIHVVNATDFAAYTVNP